VATAAPPARPAAGRPKGPDRATIALLTVAALVAVGGVGFALGHATAPGSAANAAPSGFGGFGGFGGPALASLAPGQTFGPGGFGGGAASISGTVVSVDGPTMTVKEVNGSVVTVDLTSSTGYASETPADQAQVVAGSVVTVQIDTAALAGQTPAPGASRGAEGRILTAAKVLITGP
jgi:hypothetical protein